MTAEQHYHKATRHHGAETSERGYLDLLAKIMLDGIDKSDRTGTGTRSLFAPQLRFDLAAGFPLLTTKRVHLKAAIHELLWFISGSTNERELSKHGVNIWREWAREDGDLGPIYGKQWRAWGASPLSILVRGEELTPGSVKRIEGFVKSQDRRQQMLILEREDASLDVVKSAGIDQLANVIERIKTHPDCRRLIVSAWNVADLPEMALAPCHVSYQFYVARGRLSCHMYQRSADMFLGVPFNIASYALLTMMIAQVTDLELGELVISFGDAHVYSNHFDQVRTQLEREPRALPTMLLDTRVRNIDDFKFEDFELLGYDPHPAIRAPVSV